MTRSSRSASKKQEENKKAPSPDPKGKRTKSNVSKDPQPEKKAKRTASIAKSLTSSVKNTKKQLTGSKKVEKTKSKDSLNSGLKKATNQIKDQKKESVKEVKVTLKGGVPVDTYVKNKQTRVLTYNGITYAATLNQSDVQHNNNKFYIIQALESQTNANNFYFFTRWGRVGVPGQMAEAGPMTRDKAISQYNSKMRDKTKSGNYRIVEMNYEAEEKQQKKEQAKGQTKKQEQVQSSLDKNVQDLMRLIFDMKMMNNQMKEIGYDASKMPLGKLAKSSIMKGYQALKKLMEEVKGKKRKQILAEQTNEFFSYIPHDFGFKSMSMFILDTELKIRAKLQMLQSLEDIQVFTKLLDQGKISSDMNELDSNYLKLNTEIKTIGKDTEEFKIIEKYVKNTHATTHTAFQLQIEDVFSLSKQQQNKRYKTDISNKQLLWHGSRLTNYVGILSQGLRIAPPQAPVTGYMFGKGVYFADMVSKSANYCFTNKTSNTGLMLLCQVALGNCNDKFYADYYANLLPENKHSTKGCGKTAPEGGEQMGDIWVPNGLSKNTNVNQGGLLYNQFIVYDVAQIKCKYLLRMKFVYP